MEDKEKPAYKIRLSDFELGGHFDYAQRAFQGETLHERFEDPNFLKAHFRYGAVALAQLTGVGLVSLVIKGIKSFSS